MKGVRAGDYDLVVAYLGYQTYQQRISVNDSIPVSLSIKMVVLTTNLSEVTVKSKKDDQWNIRYKKFEREFFGISPYSKECKIVNPWVLEFTEDAKGLLVAKASQPLEIENLGLGYKLTCQLKEFATGTNVYKISGTYRFEEASTSDTTLSALWHSRRQDVYRGSPRHLMRAIVQNRVTEEGFDLYTDVSNSPEVLRNSSFLTNVNVSLKALPPTNLSTPGKKPGQYTIYLPSRIEIHYLQRSAPAKIYRNVLHPISWIEVTGGSIDVNADGIVMNPARMTALGAMSEARVAELLPFDFQPNKTVPVSNTDQPVAGTGPYSKLAALLEKPYVVTDKPYYYPSDAILFKAFFNYISPAYRDSLSRVMRVELLDASQKIIYTKMYPIIAGTSYGDFALPTATQPGDYTLRVYTRWMLNFDKHLVFTKAIKVLPLEQLGRMKDIEPVAKQIAIRTEKDQFTTREKITLSIDPTNFYGNPVAADLVVSVTDIEQAAIPINEKTIINSFPFTKDMLPDSTLLEPKYMIQSGIDFQGQFVLGKKNTPSVGTLTVYQDHVSDVFAVATDDKGRFHQQLQLMDSIELLVAARSLKGYSGKVIMDEIKEPAPSFEAAAPLQVDFYKPADPAKYHVVDLFSTARMLQEVTIEAKRVERVSADKKHLLSDSHIDGDFLRSTNAPDLLSAIRGRVPGLKVVYYTDLATGDVKKFIGFSGVTSFGLQEALVELDGVVLSGMGGESVADRLSSMSVNDVESIDILRFGSASAYGARAANGVIVIKTRLGNGASSDGKRVLDRRKLQSVRMLGYSIAKEFTSPDYSDHTNGDDRADYRSTIYWNPLLVSDGKDPLSVSFYAADIPTSYRIVVEGVTADGQAIRGEKIIVVTDKK